MSNCMYNFDSTRKINLFKKLYDNQSLRNFIYFVTLIRKVLSNLRSVDEQ